MKQYKLIKEYPGSPKLDTKIIKSNIYRKTGKEVIQSFMIKGEVWFRLDDPENYPEFWELVVEKDYEILRFVIPGGNSIHVQNAKNSIEFMLKNPNTYKIYQVKRLYDGEVFTIGDKIGNGKGAELLNIKITSFNIEDPYMVKTSSGCCKLDNIEHRKKPLFTTEDGVEIFEGDKIYSIDRAKLIFKDVDRVIKSQYFERSSVYKYFSTKEKAEEYILYNKPCLCVNDILKLIETCRKKGVNFKSSQKEIEFTFNLENLVKQKLNN
jgi:hypothetical protein